MYKKTYKKSDEHSKSVEAITCISITMKKDYIDDRSTQFFTNSHYKYKALKIITN